MKSTKYRYGSLIALSVGGVICLSTQRAFASTQTPVPQDENYVYQYRNTTNTYQGQFAGDWVQCNYVQVASYPQTYGCSENVTVTAGVSGSVSSIPLGEISALLGFSVNWSYSEGIGSNCAITVPAGAYGPIQVGSDFWQPYVVDQFRLCTVQGSCGNWGTQASTVQRRDSATYRFAGV